MLRNSRAAPRWQRARQRNRREKFDVGRTPFQMTDEQAGKLVMLVAPLRDQYPPGGPSNRPFVHEFIKAVYAATGRTFSPAIYRRLLDAYAPDRKPSTSTLALEKEFVERELAGQVPSPAFPTAVPASSPAVPAGDIADLLKRAVEDALARRLDSIGSAVRGDQQMAQAHIADLSNRLAASDRTLAEVRGQAARLAAELQLATEREADMRVRLQQAEAAAKAQRDAQLAALKAVGDELVEIRRFAMRSIDDVRGETRTERERRVQLEELLKRNERLMETFRQIAYQRGGQIPAELRMEPPR